MKKRSSWITVQQMLKTATLDLNTKRDGSKKRAWGKEVIINPCTKQLLLKKENVKGKCYKGQYTHQLTKLTYGLYLP